MRLLLIVLLLLNLLALASGLGWLGRSSTRGEPERLSNQLNPERVVLRAPEEPGARPAPPPPTATRPPPPPEPGPQPAPEVLTEPPAVPEPAPESSAAPSFEPESAPEQEPAVGSQGVDDAPAAPAAPQAPGAETSAPPAPEFPAEPRACIAFDGLAEAQADALAAAVPDEVDVARSMTSTPTAWWVRIAPDGGREGATKRVEEIRALGVTDYFIAREAGPNQFAISLGLFKTQAKAEEHLEFLRGKGVRGAAVAPRTAATYRIEFSGPAAAVATLENSRAAARSGGTRSACTP